MNMENNKELWTQFLQLYKNLPCLWDPASKDYRKKAQRDLCYQLLVAKLEPEIPDVDVKFVKRKIENIRCSFRREHSKVLTSRIMQDEDVYESHLWYYDLLTFLVDTNDIESKEQVYCEDIGQLAHDEVHVSEIVPANIEFIQLTNCTDEATLAQLTSGNVTIQSPIQEVIVHEPVLKPVPQPEPVTPSISNQVNDDCLIFGKHVANELKSFKPNTQRVAKYLINNLLYSAALGNYDK